MHRYGDYLLKLERASRHLNDLESELTQWCKRSKNRTIKERDPDGGPDGFRIRIRPEVIPPDPFAVIIGDVVHNLRSTLDILAFELLRRRYHPNRPPDDLAQSSQFPIVGNENSKGMPRSGADLWTSAGVQKQIAGIDPLVQASIHALQPYHRGNDYKSHKLWMLHNLSNIDKHRLLLVATLALSHTLIMPNRIVNAVLQPGTIHVHAGFIEGETVIVRYSARPADPNKEMDVDFDFFLHVVFKCGSVVDRKSVFTTLTEIRDFVANDVVKPLSKYV